MAVYTFLNEMSGMTLMLQFQCGRCGKKHIEPFKSYIVPEGWRECDRNMPLLCPECHKALNEFMKVGRIR